MLAAETGTTQAQLVAKGLNVVFRTYGKPTIAAEQWLIECPRSG